MSTVTTIAGQLDAKGLKVAIVATRFNDFIVDRLVGGALDYLERHGLEASGPLPWCAFPARLSYR